MDSPRIAVAMLGIGKPVRPRARPVALWAWLPRWIERITGARPRA